MFHKYIALLALTLTFASQANASSSVDFALEADVPVSCVVSKSNSINVLPIDLSTTDTQTISDVTYKCNNPAGFTRTIASAEGGALRRVDGSETILYRVAHSGGDLATPGLISLETPYTSSHVASSAYAVGRVATLRLAVKKVYDDLLAGKYVDTITITIVGN